MTDPRPLAGELILYHSDADAVRVEVLHESETFWLDQRRSTELLGVDAQTVSEHRRNVYASRELSEEATIRETWIVRSEGNREVVREVRDYAEVNRLESKRPRERKEAP
ncbi:MAG: hypothetical protein KBG48_13005 [Kofleriaceae bacterium]|jgi:hypothetical protein|nr:hypothetical protein [Kofleriaceae bacterium]MBP9168305.1 hypothetical protein [Kofleriaceae bacterium]MBP9857184.1 hypothetical protein [Kofleriaceae bacterium]